jgi:hypothetical protein
MILSQINKADILQTFGTHKQFNKEIDKAIHYAVGSDRTFLASTKFYYNLVFKHNHNMLEDVINYGDLFLESIEVMERLYKINPLRVYKFLEVRITANLLYVSKIKKLA